MIVVPPKDRDREVGHPGRRPSLRAAAERELEVRGARKGTNGVSTNGVTANFMFLTGTFWVHPLTCVYLPKSARAYICPQSVSKYYFCSAPISGGMHTHTCVNICICICICIYIYIYMLMSTTQGADETERSVAPCVVAIHIYIYIYIYIYICIDVCIYTYIYIYIYMYYI